MCGKRKIPARRNDVTHRPLLGSWFITEAREPNNLRLATEPLHLLLGIIAMCLLIGGNGTAFIDLVLYHLHGLLVSKRTQRTHIISIFLQQASGLFHKTVLEHTLRAIVYALVERTAIGI